MHNQLDDPNKKREPCDRSAPECEREVLARVDCDKGTTMALDDKLKQQTKNVILELVRQSPGDELNGRVRLFKAFYFAHLYHARDCCEYLTEWPIVRMPMGPGIDKFDSLLRELCEEGSLSVKDESVGPYVSEVFQASRETAPELDDARAASIRKAIEYIEDKNGAELSELTHEHSKSWKEAADGDELNIYRDIMPEEEIDAIKSMEDEFNAAWDEAVRCG